MMTEVLRNDGTFTGFGSTEIAWRSWSPMQTASQLFVISHGFAEHGGCYDELGQTLAGLGCAVYAVDHRGHGRSGGARGQLERLAHLSDDLAAMIAQARLAHPGVPLVLFGHSMGGALAVKYILDNPVSVDRLALCGPGLWFNHVPAPAQWLLGKIDPVFPKIPVLRVLPTKLTSDPDKAAEVAADPLSYHGWAPLRLAGEMLRLTWEIQKRLQELTLPIFIQHGSADPLTRLEGSRMAIEKVRSQDKTLLVYEGLRHNLFKEVERGRKQALADLGNWILHADSGSSEGSESPIRTSP